MSKEKFLQLIASREGWTGGNQSSFDLIQSSLINRWWPTTFIMHQPAFANSFGVFVVCTQTKALSHPESREFVHINELRQKQFLMQSKSLSGQIRETPWILCLNGFFARDQGK